MKTTSFPWTKFVFRGCFVIALLCVLALGCWRLFAEMALGPGGPPFWLSLRTWQFVLCSFALVGYFKWPWMLMLLSEIIMALVITGVFPWETKGLANFAYQFSFDITLFLAAHIGTVAFFFRRMKGNCMLQVLRHNPARTFAFVLSLFLAGCKSPAPAPSAPVEPTTAATTYPARPTIAPASYKVFHFYNSSYTLVTSDNATDDQVESIIWQLRDAARAHTIDALHIPQLTQKNVDAGDPNIWFHIYRGAKCAAEKFAPGKPPCGGSYHASGDYTFTNKPIWDKGVLLHDEHATALWDTEAPYTPSAK